MRCLTDIDSAEMREFRLTICVCVSADECVERYAYLLTGYYYYYYSFNFIFPFRLKDFLSSAMNAKKKTRWRILLMRKPQIKCTFFAPACLPVLNADYILMEFSRQKQQQQKYLA